MKQRDIEILLKQKGFEQGVLNVLMRLAEEHNDLESTMREMVQAVSSMSDVIVALNVVADGMKYKIDTMGQKDDDGRSTQSIAKGD